MEKGKLAVAVFALLAVGAMALANYSSVRSQLEPWYNPIVSQDEVKLALWAGSNLPPLTLYAADLFACEMLTATSRGICTIGGAWELADNANERFAQNEKAFLSNSSREAWEIFSRYNASYALSSPRVGFYAYGYKAAPLEKFNDNRYFQLVYEQGQAKLYRIVKQ